jgi:hypothetical protein
MSNNFLFYAGQTVWIRSLEEILGTLDADGKLDGLPFMPEMTRYCGRSFRISCLPIKTCVEGVGFRGLNGIMFLENLRCDGASHDGCQRECLLFWNQAWLSEHGPKLSQSQKTNILKESTATAGTHLKTRQGDRYFCQSTELAGATSAYHEDTSGTADKFRQYLSDVRHGNMSLTEFFRRVLKAIFNRLKDLAGIDTGGKVLGRHLKTESVSLDLQPGEWVEVKSRKEIEETLDVDGKNRGLLFDPPMLAYCGNRYRVANRLQKIILEETGRMISLRNTLVLDDVVCRAWDCPRANLHFWREIWLKRVV